MAPLTPGACFRRGCPRRNGESKFMPFVLVAEPEARRAMEVVEVVVVVI